MKLDSNIVFDYLNSVDAESFILPKAWGRKQLLEAEEKILSFRNSLVWLEEYKVSFSHYGDSLSGSMLNWIELKKQLKGRVVPQRVGAIYFSRFGSLVTLEVIDELNEETFGIEIAKKLIESEFCYIDFSLIKALPYSGRYRFDEITWFDRYFCDMPSVDYY